MCKVWHGTIISVFGKHAVYNFEAGLVGSIIRVRDIKRGSQ